MHLENHLGNLLCIRMAFFFLIVNDFCYSFLLSNSCVLGPHGSGYTKSWFSINFWWPTCFILQKYNAHVKLHGKLSIEVTSDTIFKKSHIFGKILTNLAMEWQMAFGISIRKLCSSLQHGLNITLQPGCCQMLLLPTKYGWL